jgi:riboflavin synthase alpha subunit
MFTGIITDVGRIVSAEPKGDLRLRIEAGESFDRHDWGGCGCSIDPREEKPAA